MKILILTRWLSTEPDDGTMINDLAETLQDLGHEVRVLCTDWKNQTETGEYLVNGVPVWWYGETSIKWLPKRLAGPLKWLTVSPSARRHFRGVIEDFAPDGIVVTSLTIFYTGILGYFKRRLRRPMLLILWDFFPYYSYQVGVFKSRALFHIGLYLESRQLRLFDLIGLMTQSNIDYFENAYPGVRGPRLEVIPIWGAAPDQGIVDRAALRKNFDLPNDKVIAVYGGKLGVGRGIHGILELARQSQKDITDVYFVLIGDGPLRPTIDAFITEHQLDNITCLRRVERKIYQQFLTACDIGIVSTVSDVDMPSFPSKSIDYFRNQVPILASVAENTDYPDILENQAKAGLAAKAGNMEEFKAKLAKLVRDKAGRRKMGKNGLDYFMANMEVSSVACQVVDLLEELAEQKK